jgi:outer membrane protein OmpA-like peptidoglycan-associated protein
MTNFFKLVLCIAFFATAPLLQAQWYFELASNDSYFSDYSISTTATTAPTLTPTNLESFKGIRDFSYGFGYLIPFKKVEERLVDNESLSWRINTGLSFDNMNLRTNAHINNVGYPTNYHLAQIQGRLGVMLTQTLFSKNEAVDGNKPPALALALNGGMGYNHFTAASRQSRTTTTNLLNNDKEFKRGYLSYYYGAGLHFYLSKYTQLFAEYRMEQGVKISEKSGTNNEVTDAYRVNKNKLVFGLVVDLKLANRIKKQRKVRLTELEANVDTLTTIANTPTPTSIYDDSAIVARIDSIEHQLAQKLIPNQLNESSLETEVNEQGVRYFKNFEYVTFPNNSSYFNKKSYANLFFKLTSFLKQNPNVRLQLVGYADKTGPLTYNLAISRRRAKRVRDHLINTYGVAPSRIEATGAGETQQFSISNSRENRRTEIIILQD